MNRNREDAGSFALRRESESDDAFGRAVLRASGDAVCRLDGDGRVLDANDELCRLVEREHSTLVGDSLASVVSDDDGRRVESSVEEAVTDPEFSTVTASVAVPTSDGPCRCTFHLSRFETADGSLNIAGVLRPDAAPDANETRLRRERDGLAVELDEMFERLSGGVLALDTELRFTYANEYTLRYLDVGRDELLGSHVWDVLDVEESSETAIHEALVTRSSTTFEEYYAPADVWVEGTVYPSDTGLSLYFRDVTERKRREHELRQYESIVETVSDGVYAVDGDDRFVFVNDAYAEMVGYSRERLLGSPVTLVYDDISERTLSRIENVRTNERERTTVETELRTADGRTIVAETKIESFQLADGDGRLGVCRNVTERKRRERRLERQRSQLSTLNDLNEVVNEIAHAVVESSTRDEIERRVCNRLAESSSYSFAWVGAVDAETEEVVPRTESGAAGYLDDVTITVDDSDTGAGPTARAIRTQEVAVVRDTANDPTYRPWNDRAREFGVEASAAIPIAYEGSLYGVLNVYTDRFAAFGERERRLVGRLGEIIAHAIAAIERKEALMSDDIVEVKFHINNLFAALDIEPADDVDIRFERTVPLGDDQFLEYGRASSNSVDTLHALVDQIPHFEAVNLFATEFDEVRFELGLSQPPVSSIAAEHGGRIREGRIQDGEYQLTVELPHSADVRAVVDAVQASYPELELIAQRHSKRRGVGEPSLSKTLWTTLTDRQRAALEAAYYSGFFEWPRESSGNDVAEALGVSSPTFHQHLRHAQRKLFEALLER
ncbi:bacterio-opsin activator domain-containing protein [Haloprofundus halobius]|uniref:bacterio-opsin activator domain-containing protein n=1 Tax=Haloprofundus halobius TaxID=2876194 RepID=UPI001CCD0125|nr:bacterio-opsin activator domain-containing protein [Haloprofundus halobius]